MGNIAISASGVGIVVVTAKTPKTGTLIGVVESFSAEMALNAEIINAVGSYIGVDSLMHGGQGTFNIGRPLFKNPKFDWVSLGIIPGEAEFASYQPFQMRVIDVASKRLLLHARNCIPNHHGINFSAQAKLETSLSGMCYIVKVASELVATTP